jgi:hypothetical protein
MRNTCWRLASLARAAALVALALGVASPAAAQIGSGLTKKLKKAAGQDGANKAGEQAGVAAPEEAQAAGAPAGGAGGQVVLTEDVVNRMIAGLKAAQAERAAAEKEDTPFSRYKRDMAAYEDAKAKCTAAQTDWPRRAMADKKLADRYNAMAEKMMNHMNDQKLYAIYADSAMAIMSPSCLVKQPAKPDGEYEYQREVDSRAEKAEMKGSGMSRSELAMAKERTDAILRKATGSDISTSEKNAVEKHADELKRLMGYEVPAPARAQKPAPAAAPAPTPAAPASATPTVAPGQQAMAECMGKNAQKHEKEIQELGARGQEAQKRNDTATMMAIADSINQITMAGCNKDQ